MRCISLTAAAMTAFVCLAPTAAAGETILVTITSGSVQVGPGGDPVNMAGTSGFSLTSNLGFGNTCVTTTCIRQEGETLQMSGGWSGLDILTPSLTINGVTYTDINGFNSSDALTLDVVGASVAAPPVQPGPATVQAPFTFSGQFTHAGTGEGDEGFIAMLTGQGTATLSLFGVVDAAGDIDLWNSTGILWEFAAVSTEPIPEPGTITLIGFGLAGAWGAARRRRRQAVSAGSGRP